MVWGSAGILAETEGSPVEEVLSSVGTQGILGEPQPAEDIRILLSSESQPWSVWAARFLVVVRSCPGGSQGAAAGVQAGSQS